VVAPLVAGTDEFDWGSPNWKGRYCSVAVHGYRRYYFWFFGYVAWFPVCTRTSRLCLWDIEEGRLVEVGRPGRT
jgi:hypothetical protein